MQSPASRFAFAALAILALAAVLWSGPSAPVQRAASGLLGERWYRVELHGDTVGAFASRATRGADGYRFETDLRFRLGAGPEVRITDALAYGPAPEHRLTRAEHVYTSGDTTLRTALERRGEALEAVVAGERVALDWDYRLSDYVALEAWLAGDREPPARFMTRSLDLGRLAVDRQLWQVTARDATGYELRQAATFGDTWVRLDDDLAPLRFDLGGVFSVERVTGAAEASVWRTAVANREPPRYRVALDRPLTAPHDVKRLTLRVRVPDSADAGVWPALSPDGDGAWMLVTGDDPPRAVPADEAVALSGPSSAFPANDPAVGRLAERAVLGAASPTAQVDALVHFVHGYVDYADRDDVQSVTDTITTRRGDCTEYAALLATLARARGFPARTVTGLAYDGDATAFALHSWTEIAVDGIWRGVDPTWAQTRLDATHIRLPDEPGLAVLGLLPHLAFEVVAAEY